jgi:hemin uptake protein HemP
MTIKVNNVIWTRADANVAACLRKRSGSRCQAQTNKREMNGGQVMTTAIDERHEAQMQSAAQEQVKVRVQVAELLRGGREAILEHDGMDYRLRITANGKLILTK